MSNLNFQSNQTAFTAKKKINIVECNLRTIKEYKLIDTNARDYKNAAEKLFRIKINNSNTAANLIFHQHFSIIGKKLDYVEEFSMGENYILEAFDS